MSKFEREMEEYMSYHSCSQCKNPICGKRAHNILSRITKLMGEGVDCFVYDWEEEEDN